MLVKDQIESNPKVTPFEFRVPKAELARILDRVANFPWHEMPDDGGWDYGANLDYMKCLSDYWANDFNWRAQEKEINNFPHVSCK